MSTDHPSDDAVGHSPESYLEMVASLVEEHGWAGQFVFDPDGVDPLFGFTVGCTATGLPELLVVGLPPEHAHALLGEVRSRLLADPLPVNLDATLLLTDDYLVRFRRVALDDEQRFQLPGHRPLSVRLAHLWLQAHGGGGSIEVLQVLYPSPDGLFPDDPAYAYGHLQLLADEPTGAAS